MILGIAEIMKKRKETETFELPSGQKWTVNRLVTKDLIDIGERLGAFERDPNQQLGYLLSKFFVSVEIDGEVMLRDDSDSEVDYQDEVANMDAADSQALMTGFMELRGITEDRVMKMMANPDFREQLLDLQKKK